jgi:uncharacterized protein YaaQ
MKLVIAIVDDLDAEKIRSRLIEAQLSVTHISTTSSWLAPGTSTLLIGVEGHELSRVKQLIQTLAAQRVEYVVNPYIGGMPIGGMEVEMGGFTTFVLDVLHFEQV